MAHDKRTRNNYTENLGIFHITRKDILALEDIVKKHDRRDLSKTPFSDTYIEYNTSIFGGRGIKLGIWELSIQFGVNYNHSTDSISDIPNGARIPYLRIHGQPGISLEFTPRKTMLHVQRGMAKGIELKSMDQAAERIKKRLSKKHRSLFNKIDI